MSTKFLHIIIQNINHVCKCRFGAPYIVPVFDSRPGYKMYGGYLWFYSGSKIRYTYSFQILPVDTV